MWIDMTDPYLIWKKMSEAIYENFPAENGQESYALNLVIFFLESFKLNDEEMQHMHMPMFLLFLLTKIQVIRLRYFRRCRRRYSETRRLIFPALMI